MAPIASIRNILSLFNFNFMINYVRIFIKSNRWNHNDFSKAKVDNVYMYDNTELSVLIYNIQ
jgi:hypothetical protein